MRVGGALLTGAAPVLPLRRTARNGAMEAPDAATMPSSPAVHAELPHPVADRLDWLMANDPALAQAINARLPAARQASAKDLAAYVATSRPSRVDITG